MKILAIYRVVRRLDAIKEKSRGSGRIAPSLKLKWKKSGTK